MKYLFVFLKLLVLAIYPLKIVLHLINGRFILGFTSILFIIFCTNVYAVQKGRLAAPEVQVIDKHGVNLVGNQVSPSLDTVAIGGEGGLSHSITVDANHFSHIGNWGYQDKYAGSAKYSIVGAGKEFKFNPHDQDFPHDADIWMMKVFGPTGSHDFMVYRNGQMEINARDFTGNYEYRSMGDTRHTLKRQGRYLIWTNPDGIVSRFKNPRLDTPVKVSTPGQLTDITYPNGFKVYIDAFGVTTNTGFQLKYQLGDHGELSSAKRAIYNSLPTGAQLSRDTSWGRNPVEVIGINRAYEYCSNDSTVQCNSSGWPTAKFDWPGGSPMAFYLGNSIFKVTDAGGGVTEYHYEAHDVCAQHDNCQLDPRILWSSRMTGIKSAVSDFVDKKYHYVNDVSPRGVGSATIEGVNSRAGILTKAETINDSGIYGKSILNQGQDYSHSNGFDSVDINAQVAGKLLKADFEKQGKFYYEVNWRNFVVSHRPVSGPSLYYHYDNRGNLEKVIRSSQHSANAFSRYPASCSDSSTCTMTEAYYPSACTNPKTCNKPIWIKDAKGQKTHYTYHPSSGQIASITYPADNEGKVAQTRFEYAQKRARFLTAPGSYSTGTPIWLKTAEKYCMNSNYTGSSCAGNDEVITRYTYDSDNLFLTSMTIIDPKTNAQRTTCYEYDKRGRKIGETQPLGNCQ